MRVVLTSFMVVVGGLGVMAASSPAQAWYDHWGRWHPNHYHHPTYYQRYYRPPVYYTSRPDR